MHVSAIFFGGLLMGVVLIVVSLPFLLRARDENIKKECLQGLEQQERLAWEQGYREGWSTLQHAAQMWPTSEVQPINNLDEFVNAIKEAECPVKNSNT